MKKQASTKPCETCKKPVEAKVFWQKYCSSTCRILAWAKRKMEAEKNSD